MDARHEQRTVSKQHRSTDSGHHLGHTAERHPGQRNLHARQLRKGFHGPFQGEFTQEARHLSYEELSTGWEHGTVDASWFCVDCWPEKLDISSIDRTRKALEFPPASQLTAVVDNRFRQHRDRWSNCDNCDCYCAGRARDWLPGSFVYCTDNTPAGPPKSRSRCFPRVHDRETLWRNGSWNAKFLCRTCLVQQMAKDSPGDHRVASHAQPRRIESSLDPEAPVGKQRRQWLAGQLEWLPTRHVVGRQPGELEMKPRS